MAMKWRAFRELGSWVLGSSVTLLGVGCGDAVPTVTGMNTAGSGGSGQSGSGQGGSTASGGSAGSGNGVTSVPLIWDGGGFVAPDSNPFGIQGPLYFYSDCAEASGLPCTMPDAALTSPNSDPGWSVAPGAVCAKGTAVKVQDMMFSKQWGAGLALDLNSKGGDPGQPAMKETFDAIAAKITGFSVELSGTAPASVRINVTMPGLVDSHFVDAKVPGTKAFHFSDAKQGSYVKMKTPLDPSKLEAIQVQVATSATAATPFDFCITAIRALTDGSVANGGADGGGGSAPTGGSAGAGGGSDGGSAGASGSAGTTGGGSGGTAGNGGAGGSPAGGTGGSGGSAGTAP